MGLHGHAATRAARLLASCMARHRAAALATNVLVVGGMFAVPVLSLAGWAGLFLPARTPLHQAATALLTSSAVGLVLALAGAHAIHLRPRACEDEASR